MLNYTLLSLSIKKGPPPKILWMRLMPFLIISFPRQPSDDERTTF